jgi:hypothetical protein
MRSLFTNKLLTLEPGQTVSGIADGARTLRIVEGKVWLTVEGIRHDYWLSSGDTFTAIPGRLIVVEADGVTSSVDARSPSAAQILERIGAWIGGYAQRLFGRPTVQASLKRHRVCQNVCV